MQDQAGQSTAYVRRTMAFCRRDSRKLGRMESDGLGASDDLLTGGIGL
jgi:hypothetical protein